MAHKTSFNELVYALVRHIPPGKVLNYGRVAQLLGVERGARAVGWALSGLKNSDARDVPWHRVVNAQGRISIKGSPESAVEQRARLEAEGIEFDDRGYLDLNRYLWTPDWPTVEQIIRTARGDMSD
ncbi:MAG: cysteine methyltransferase [Chloroflexi bacterium]|nr:cysteine methyltransferase [Chloroflexota bacterium]